MDIKTIAQKLRDKLKKYEDFEGLYLYGSQAIGKPSSNSDIDIVAIFKTQPDFNKQLEIHECSLNLELENDIFIDFHPMTREELNLNWVYFDEVKKGIFYAAR